MRTYIFTAEERTLIHRMLDHPRATRSLNQRQIKHWCGESVKRLEHDFNLYLRVLQEVIEKPVSVILNYDGVIVEEVIGGEAREFWDEGDKDLTQIILNLGGEPWEVRVDLLEGRNPPRRPELEEVWTNCDGCNRLIAVPEGLTGMQVWECSDCHIG